MVVCNLCSNNELCVFGVAHIYVLLRFFYFSDIMTDKDKTALFIGNRDCYQVIEADIERAIIEVIESGIDYFLNGGQGYYDKTCAIIVHRLKKTYPYIKSILVIPYRDFKAFSDDLFDEIIYPFEAHHFSYYTYKRGIPKRNRWMVLCKA